MAVSFKMSLLVASAMCAVPAFAQDVASAGDEAATGIQDIVVTAQKREQRLQDVPVAVTALSEEAIAANRIMNVNDLSSAAPNLTVTTTPGGNQAPLFVLRGEYGANTSPGSDKGIALYIDGVYLGAASGTIFDLADIQRIEVLRGPQGTLFGRNATAGALSIYTRDPSGNFGIRAQGTIGNYNQFQGRLRVETPQIGPFSAIINYAHSQRDGEVRNLGAGTVLDFGPATGGKRGKVTSPKRLGDNNTNAVSLALKTDIVDGLKTIYKFDYSKSDYTPIATGVDYAQGLATTLAGVVRGFPAGTTINMPAGLQTPVTTKRPKAVNNSFTAPGNTKVYGHNLTMSYQLNDVISFKNVLAYRYTGFSAPAYQLDGYGGVTITIPGVGTSPFVLLGTSSSGKEKQWSNEFQMNISTDWFQLTAGLLHFDDHITKSSAGSALQVTQFRPLIGGVVPFDLRYRNTRVRVRSDAAFVQHEQHLTDALDLVLGARITRDRKTGVDNTVLGTPLPINYEESRPTFLAGVNYKPAQDVLVYGKYSTGYISGGVVGGIAFDPETAKSWEAGVKSRLFDRKLQANLALFTVKYGAVQTTTAGVNVGSPASSVVYNVGEARAKGVELETVYQPIRSIQFTGNIGYTDFRFMNLSPIAIRSGAYTEFMRPEVTANMSAQYTSEPVFGDATLLLRADASYKSKYLTTLSACGLICSVNPTPQQAILDTGTVRNFWLVNSRAALRDISIAGTKAEVALWGRNIFNNKKMGFASGFGFLYTPIYERARTYGVDLTIEF